MSDNLTEYKCPICGGVLTGRRKENLHPDPESLAMYYGYALFCGNRHYYAITSLTDNNNMFDLLLDAWKYKLRGDSNG